MSKFVRSFFMFLGIIFCVFVLISIGGVLGRFQTEYEPKVSKDSILEMNLEGVILDGRHFVESLRKYSKQKNIKGVLVRINSPGGVVGPSQEIYAELKRVRDELQKPVVAYCSSMAASGAYYAAVAADRIVTNPGTIVGSIGVIMEFANLQGLYDWAKVKRFAITTGQYKDSGSEYRPMRPDERRIFQDLIDGVHEQFKVAVAAGRKLDREIVDKYADGRVFTGEDAVKMGFADKLGTFEDARRVIGELSDLGDDPEMFKPPKKRRDFMELFAEVNESSFSKLKDSILSLKLSGQPLYLMPGSFGH